MRDPPATLDIKENPTAIQEARQVRLGMGTPNPLPPLPSSFPPSKPPTLRLGCDSGCGEELGGTAWPSLTFPVQHCHARRAGPRTRRSKMSKFHELMIWIRGIPRVQTMDLTRNPFSWIAQATQFPKLERLGILDDVVRTRRALQRPVPRASMGEDQSGKPGNAKRKVPSREQGVANATESERWRFPTCHASVLSESGQRRTRRVASSTARDSLSIRVSRYSRYSRRNEGVRIRGHVIGPAPPPPIPQSLATTFPIVCSPEASDSVG